MTGSARVVPLLRFKLRLVVQAVTPATLLKRFGPTFKELHFLRNSLDLQSATRLDLADPCARSSGAIDAEDYLSITEDWNVWVVRGCDDLSDAFHRSDARNDGLGHECMVEFIFRLVNDQRLVLIKEGY